MGETAIQKDIRCHMSTLRNNLFLRYQNGTFLSLTGGNYVKIGEEGVSDLIGIKAHVIRPEDVGKTVGIFVAMETKDVGPDKTSKDRKIKQGNFIRRVRELGGIGGIVRSEKEAEDLVNGDWG